MLSASLGDVVTFTWDVGKDAEAYNLVVYTDAALTQQYLSETVLPSQVPYQKKLEADKTYWFTVQASAEGKGDSKVVAYEKSFKTFAVKDNLFLKVSDRTASSVSLYWSKEVADYADVDRIEYGLPGEEPAGAVTLSASDPGPPVVFSRQRGTAQDMTGVGRCRHPRHPQQGLPEGGGRLAWPLPPSQQDSAPKDSAPPARGSPRCTFEGTHGFGGGILKDRVS